MPSPPHQPPDGAATKVSAVILSFNRAPALAIVLDRLAELPLHEVVVADSGTDESAELARSRPGVTVLQMEDIGTACRNVGAAESTGDLLLMLDDDSYPLPGAVERMVEHFERDPKLGALGGFVRDVEPDGEVNAATGPGSFDWFLRAGQEGAPEDGLPSFFFPEGAVMLRRTAFQEVGGWFEPYFLALSELDLATRLLGAGWDVRYEPRAEFDHMKAEGGMRAAAPTLRRRIRNQIWYFSLRFPAWLAMLRIPTYLAFDLVETTFRGVARKAWAGGIADAWRDRDAVRGRRQVLPRPVLRRAEMNRGRLHFALLWSQLSRRMPWRRGR